VELDTIESVFREHQSGLMSLDCVVGVAIGECNGRPCIKVYVSQKDSAGLKKIPAVLGGYHVSIESTGEFRALK
jgi:hypothetical protein